MTRQEILDTWCTFVPPRQFARQHYPVEHKRLRELLVGRLQRHPTYCGLVAKCRDEARRGDLATDSGKVTKRQLPTWLVGKWGGTGKKEQIIAFEPFMFFDIDTSDNVGVSVDEMKRRLSAIPCVAVVAVSARGQGVYGLVQVPREAEDEEVYKGHFRAFERVLTSIGLRGDGQCKNVNRGRYLSIDPEPYIAESCEPFTDWLPDFSTHTATRPSASPVHAYAYDAGDNFNYNRVMHMVEQCERQGIDPFPVADDWRNMGRALAAKYGERGREPFIRWSNLWSSLTHKTHDKDPNAVYDELSRQCDRFKTLGIIFDRCDRVGVYGSPERRKRA